MQRHKLGGSGPAKESTNAKLSQKPKMKITRPGVTKQPVDRIGECCKVSPLKCHGSQK